MSYADDQIRRLVEAVPADGDPIQALEALAELHLALERMSREQAARALMDGRSFGDLGHALGISRQAAHRRFRGLAPTSSPAQHAELVATEDAGRVLRMARDEAVRSDAGALGSEHVLMAVLRLGGTGTRVLHRHDVRLEIVRVLVGGGVDSRRAPDREGHAAGLRRVLSEAASVTLARGRDLLDVDALLLAALADPVGGARWVLSALGASVTSIRDELDFEAALADRRRPRATAQSPAESCASSPVALPAAGDVKKVTRA